MKTHELKTINPHFTLVWSGLKTFELRKNDRGFQVGDHLRLMEYDPAANKFTGSEIWARVKHILHGGEYGLDPNYCILSIQAYKRTGPASNFLHIAT